MLKFLDKSDGLTSKVEIHDELVGKQLNAMEHSYFFVKLPETSLALYELSGLLDVFICIQRRKI